MYNFNFFKNEKLIKVFDDIWVREGKNEKTTTIAITNQRLLFLDYDNNDPRENLRISGKLNYIRYKEIYYSIKLEDIKNITKKSIGLIDGKNIEIDNKEVFELLKNIS